MDWYGFTKVKQGKHWCYGRFAFFIIPRVGKGLGVGHTESWIMAWFIESNQALVNISGGNLSFAISLDQIKGINDR